MLSRWCWTSSWDNSAFWSAAYCMPDSRPGTWRTLSLVLIVTHLRGRCSSQWKWLARGCRGLLGCSLATGAVCPGLRRSWLWDGIFCQPLWCECLAGWVWSSLLPFNFWDVSPEAFGLMLWSLLPWKSDGGRAIKKFPFSSSIVLLIIFKRNLNTFNSL